MRSLGLDWGESRIGVALSDPLGISALPLPYIANNGSVFSAIKQLVEGNAVKEIVLGFPKNMNGTEGKSAEKVRIFKDKLEKNIRVPVKLWDERLTTKLAQQTLASSGLSALKMKGKVDSASACMILQSYMDANRK